MLTIFAHMNRRFRINVLLGGLFAALVMIFCRWLENRQAVAGAMENGRYVTVGILIAFLYHYIIQLRAERKDVKLSFIRVLLPAVGFMLSIWFVYVLVQAAALYSVPKSLDSSLVLSEENRVSAYFRPEELITYKSQIRWQEFFVQETLMLAGGLLICILIAAIVPNRAKTMAKPRRQS